MTVPSYRRFLAECIINDPAQQPGLREDEMYGVYLSWCFLNQEQPAPDAAFWAAMSDSGYKKSNTAGRKVCPGLGMKGPAAVDYILSSQPSLI
jgi:hypothetical protein